MAWYDVSKSGGAISKGDVVCVDPKDPTRITLANAETLSAVGLPLGVAITEAAAGATAQVVERGVVSASQSQLGSGEAAWVVVSDLGRCKRDDVNNGGTVIGRALPDGTLLVSPMWSRALLRDLVGASVDGAVGDSTSSDPIPEPQTAQSWPAVLLTGASASRAVAPLITALRLTQSMSIELWVRPDELVDDKVLLGTDHDGEGELMLSTGSANSTRLLGETRSCQLIFTFGGSGAGRQRLSAVVECVVGTWFHVAVVRQTAADNTHTVQIYKDGVSVLEQRTAAVTVASPGYKWALGGNGYTPLAGGYADLRLWSTARTAAEIAAKMRTRLKGTESGLVGYWKLDETGAPSTLAHATDPSLNLTATAVAGVKDGPGVPAELEVVSALRFDGDTRLMLGRPPAHPWDGSYTVEMWLRPATDIARDCYVFFQYSADGCLFGVFINGSLWGPGGARSAAGSLRLGQWSHIAVVTDRSGESRTAPALYINGALVASTPAPVAAYTYARPSVVGYQPTPTWGDSYKGDISELRIWSRALAATEIRPLMQRRPAADQSGLAAWYSFASMTDQVALDLSTYANHGVVLRQPAVSVAGPTLISAATLPSPKLLMGSAASPALRFDGKTGTALRVPDHATNRQTGDLSIECWVRFNALSYTAGLYEKSDVSEGCLYLNLWSTEKAIRWYGDGNTRLGPNATNCPAEIALNTWTHIAFVRDATRRELRYYINGNLAQIDTDCTPVTGKTTNGAVNIGPRLVGDMCELRIWSVPRDEASIRRDLGLRITSAAGLVARWSMSDGAGTVAKNSSEAGNAIDATLVGGVSWVTDGPALK